MLKGILCFWMRCEAYVKKKERKRYLTPRDENGLLFSVEGTDSQYLWLTEVFFATAFLHTYASVMTKSFWLTWERRSHTFQNSSCSTIDLFSFPFASQLALNDPWAEFLCHNADPEECTCMFRHFFYRLAPCVHVIDCSRWPETSSRFTSACNYWPPSLVSQRRWCVCVCACMLAHVYVTHRRLIGFSTCFGLSLTLPEGGNNHWIMDPWYPHTSYITLWKCNSVVSGLSLVVKCAVINISMGGHAERVLCEEDDLLWLKMHLSHHLFQC